ncbi:MAG: cobyrinate a,c-diamide synthase [Cyanobacteria bacterium P01_D01_bin.71]
MLASESYVQQSFQRHSATAAYAIVEGVMGLFDGAGGTAWASTAHIARLLNRPVVLVVDCARLSQSLAAIVHGYRTFDSRIEVAGVVLNRVGSDRHQAMLEAAIAPLQVPLLGVLRRDDAVTLLERHLGLVPTDELADLPERFRHLAVLGQRCFEWQALERLFAQSAKSLTTLNAQDSMSQGKLVDVARAQPVRIGIARDRAFNFYYEGNLELLKQCGAELVPFSPIADEQLPPDLNGLLLGGGFPEMFAAELSQNRLMRQAIAQVVAAGLPTYAECGGLMYLCKTLVDFDRKSWPMVGAIAAATTLTGQLTLGYRQATALQVGPVVPVGQQLWGHEFHRSAIAPAPRSPLYALTAFPLVGAAPVAAGLEGWVTEDLHASYLHSHWGARPALAQRFVATCNRQTLAFPKQH